MVLVSEEILMGEELSILGRGSGVRQGAGMSDLRCFDGSAWARGGVARRGSSNKAGRWPRATLAISGGSSPRPMFEIFAAAPFDWSRVQLFWVDERCVPRDGSAEQFQARQRYLARPAKFPVSNIHRVQTERDPVEAAEVYADELRLVFGGGVPSST